MAGPQCCVSASDVEYCSIGKEETLGPYLAYIASHGAPSAAVVLVNDIIGFDAPFLRKVADKFASFGFYVIVPDFFRNEPFVPSMTGNSHAALDDWIKDHQPMDSVEGANQLIKCVHKKGFSSVGAVGFCWGAKVVVELAKGDCLKAVVIAHPAFVTVEDIQEVKTPIAILGAEIDDCTPPELVHKFADALKAKPELESFTHIYQGVTHGWTCRYNPNNLKELADAETAHNEMLEWFAKFLC